MERIGGARALIRAHNRKEMDWPHPGRRLTTKNSYRKKMMHYVVAVVLL